jgi:hypothetical protein
MPDEAGFVLLLGLLLGGCRLAHVSSMSHHACSSADGRPYRRAFSRVSGDCATDCAQGGAARGAADHLVHAAEARPRVARFALDQIRFAPYSICRRRIYPVPVVPRSGPWLESTIPL